MKIKSWSKLLISIVICQSAGFVGTFFTINAIPNWYVNLVKPLFAPPNWIFGPVWIILYTLIGISLYRIWIKNKKVSLNLFWIHLVLNALWTPIFFGLKNLGLAFFEIIIMVISLVFVIKRFYKIDKVASYLLIPYLIWILFASLLNFSIWKLNSNQFKVNVFAQSLTYEKAKEDYIFATDNYKSSLNVFNQKRDSYQKNPTLSLKEEARISLYNFLLVRNNFIKSYLTALRTRILESRGLTELDKGIIFSKIDNEVNWYQNQNTVYISSDSVETLTDKSKKQDEHYTINSLPVIYHSLSLISLGDVIASKQKHIELYQSLRNESEDLTKLGRADSSLFERWYRDIDTELSKIDDIERKTRLEMEKILTGDSYSNKRDYDSTLRTLDPVKTNLLTLNRFVKELETVISEKR